MSIVSEWDLVCSRQIYITLPDTMFMVGNMLGSFIGAPLTDLYGRRKTAFGNMLGMTASLLLCLVPGGIGPFITFRLLQGYFFSTAYNAIYCIFVEYLPKSKRAMIVPLLGSYFSKTNKFTKLDMASGFASIYVGIAGLFFTDWRHTIWFYGATSFLCFISTLFYPESEEWLISKKTKGSSVDQFSKGFSFFFLRSFTLI